MHPRNQPRTGTSKPGAVAANQPKAEEATTGCRIVVIRNGQFVGPQHGRRRLGSG
jgi:hypothetical protein